DARRELLESGSVPSVSFQTATDRAKSGLPFEIQVEVVEIAKEARPFGPRFGALVHAILASTSLDGTQSEIASVAEFEGRILGAPSEEVTGAAAAVIAALEHPLLGRARAAASVGECYRELPLTLRMSNGLLVEGIADLVFRESDEWIVVDFKTDQELAAELPAYRRQISIYASAVGKAKNTHTSAFLLRV
ncbi:MAG TPA: PD-(D/E)XK nuclease family protein, partial [Terriglobales bacterium]